MKSEASSYATIPIACAPGIGKGACFAINLKATADAELIDKGISVTGPHKPIAEEVAKKTLRLLNKAIGLKLKIDCAIPNGAGLGEDEAVAVATALATIGAVSKKYGAVNELKLDKYLTKQFFIVDGAVVDKKALVEIAAQKTKKYSRVYSSMYGGFSVTDDKKGILLRKGEMEDIQVVLAANSRKKIERSLFNNEREIMWHEALRGNLYTASKLSSLLYERPEVLETLIKAGALTTAATRTGSIAALTRDEKKVPALEKVMKKLGKSYILKTANQEAKVSEKPIRIYRVNEFLKLKSADRYTYV